MSSELYWRCPNCGSKDTVGNGDNTNDCENCEYHFHDTEFVKSEDITIDDLDKGDQSFRVIFTITEGGGVMVRAKNEKEAEQKIREYLENYSKDEALEKRFDCAHREWDFVDVEKRG